MMYQEFCKLAGCMVDPAMYDEIEATYMAFETISKEEMAAMYMGKKGAYGLWEHGKTLAKELAVLDEACNALRKAGLTQNANDLHSYWDARAREYVAAVKAAKLA